MGIREALPMRASGFNNSQIARSVTVQRGALYGGGAVSPL